MMIYSKANQKSIDNAVAKARQIKPRVRITGFGQFEVQGSQPYMVTFKKLDGEFAAECGCKANENGNVCYHVAAVSAVFKKQVADRAAEKAAPALEALPEGPKCRGCGRDAFAYVMGEWTCIECATQGQAQEIYNQEQMPEIDFDANPNEQQCQNCLRLWVNDTEFAYKVCPDCRTETTRVEAGDTEGQRWAQEEAEDEALLEAEASKLGPKCAECEFMRVANEGDTCEVCIEGERLDREEFIMTEVLQPRYQRTYSWPRRSLEEVEATSPEPEHTKYEESIAEARRSLFGEVA